MLSGSVAALGLVTLPVLVGFAAQGAYDEVRRNPERLELGLRTAFRAWLIGMVVITATASFVSMFLAPAAFDVAAAVGLVGIGYCILRGGGVKTPRISLTAEVLGPAIVLLAGAFVPFWYLRGLAPFPFMPAADAFVHLAAIGSSAAGATGVYLWDDGFITTVASSSLLAHSEPLWTFWVGPVLLYGAFSIGIYWLAKRLIRNTWLCLASALLPLWFMGDGLVNDLIYLLRPNIIMCMVPFALAIAAPPTGRDREIRLAPIVISAAAALFYFLDVSTSVYNSFTGHLPIFLRYLIQPGFAATAPAYNFDVPAAVVQDFYAAIVASLLFLVAVKLSGVHEKRLLAFWYLVTCAGVLIEYRVGLLLSGLVLGVLLLRRYSSSPLPPVFGLLGLAVVGILLTGEQAPYRIFQAALSPLAHVLPGISENLLGSLQGRIQFLDQDYGLFYLYLFLLSLAALSALVWWRERSIRWVAYISVIGLFMYFTPFPDSQFFLILVTPLVGITIVLVFLRLGSFVDRLQERSRRGESGRTADPRFVRFRWRGQSRIYPPKAVYVAAACIVFLVSVSSITQVYDFNIGLLRSAYGKTGMVSGFTAQDLSAADWLKDHLPPTTLIISDPTTILILSALSGISYTTDGGRLEYAGTTVLSNVTLFKSVVAALSVPALIDLIENYSITDKYMGLNSSALQVVLIVNNRTSWWVNGLENFTLADRFMDFPGYAAYPGAPFVSSVYNVSSTYRIYTLSISATRVVDHSSLFCCQSQGHGALGMLSHGTDPQVGSRPSTPYAFEAAAVIAKTSNPIETR